MLCLRVILDLVVINVHLSEGVVASIHDHCSPHETGHFEPHAIFISPPPILKYARVQDLETAVYKEQTWC